MRTPDLDRERSEKKRSLTDFLVLYNENLPTAFPRASAMLLEEFKNTHASLFPRRGNVWSLDQHRRKVMDWLRSRKALA
jgi:hypothetical protein